MDEKKKKWEEAGKPLFTRLWTYDEIQSAPGKRRKTGSAPQPHEGLETPRGWPPGCKVDPGEWVFWLPEGWMQAIATTITGKEQKCYINKKHERYWHKKRIEEVIGYKLPSKPPSKVKSERSGGAPMRYVTDEDAIPSWPEGDWLPLNWRISYRQLPGGLHKVYVPPGQSEGFCYQIADVPLYLSGEKTRLSPFASSKQMVDIMAEGKRKRAGWNDYSEVKGFSISKVPLDKKDLKDREAKTLEEQAKEIQALLLKRKFKDPQMLAVMLKPKHTCPEESLEILKALCGVYYKRPEKFGEKLCFQQVRLITLRGKRALACREHHIFWCSQSSCWKLGSLDSERAGFLRCRDSKLPGEQKEPWQLVKESLCRRRRVPHKPHKRSKG